MGFSYQCGKTKFEFHLKLKAFSGYQTVKGIVLITLLSRIVYGNTNLFQVER